MLVNLPCQLDDIYNCPEGKLPDLSMREFPKHLTEHGNAILNFDDTIKDVYPTLNKIVKTRTE